MTQARMLLFMTLIVWTGSMARAAEPTGSAGETQDAYVQRREAAADTDAGQLTLALWCRARGLDVEADQHLERVLTLNANHVRARQLLGYERVKGAWLRGEELYRAKGFVPFRGTWRSPKEIKRLEVRRERIRELVRARSDWERAWEVKTAHFRIRSNCPPTQVQEMADALEECYKQLARIFTPRKHQPIPVDICATQAQFLELSARNGIPLTSGVLGYFYWGSDMGIRTFWAGSSERTLGTLYHECTHLIIRAAYGDVPTWSNEGMAVFFEFARLNDSGGLDIRSIPFDRLWQLQDQLRDEKRPVSLDHLVRLDGMGQYTVEYYPQGWGLTHYLLYGDKGRRLQALQKFYEQKKRREPVDDFKAAFGVTPSELTSAWRDYILALEPTSTEDLMAAAVAAIEYRGDDEAAVAYADAALAQAPGDWRAQAAKARVLLQAGRLQADPEIVAASLELFDQALAQRPAARRGARQDRTPDYLRGLACVWSGECERAIAIADEILEQDEFSANGYRLLALARALAPKDLRDLDEAKEHLAVADDLGAGHENDYVRARIAEIDGQVTEAIRLLAQARANDAFGFGARFYSYEAQRLQRRYRLPKPAAQTTGSK